MKYQIIKGRINGHHKGEIIDIDEELGNAYGSKYLKPLTEKKEAKNVSNKALTNDEVKTKGPEKN